MENSLLLTIKKRRLAQFSIVFLVVLTIWWLSIYLRKLTEGNENNIFTVTYPWVSLWGGIAGLFIARQWGGFKSVLGRAVGAFAIGLLGQAFGQAAYSYYIYILKIEIPYPSIGDYGFFSTAFFYVYGLFQLAKAVGAKVSLQTYRGRSGAVILPVIFMAISFYIFLRGYEYDWQHPVRVIMDLGWPIIDSFLLSLGMLVWLMSRKFLGGLMKLPVLFLLIALVVEAVADLNFTYQVAQEQWYVGGINDYMYLVSYTLMAIALMQLGVAFKTLTES